MKLVVKTKSTHNVEEDRIISFLFEKVYRLFLFSKKAFLPSSDKCFKPFLPLLSLFSIMEKTLELIFLHLYNTDKK